MFKCNLKQIREQHNLTQVELAEKLNVSRQTINTIENGKSYPGVPLLFQILEYFEVGLYELYERHSE